MWARIIVMAICLVFAVSSDSGKRSQLEEFMDRSAFEQLKRTIGFRERRVYSQNGEDGVVIFLQQFGIIRAQDGYYVEFGVEDGLERNTREVMENSKYTGLLMDGSNENPSINLHKEWIYSYNINQLFRKYNVPKEFDILSIDLDSFDYFVWKNISTTYRPNIVITEINSFFPPSIAVTQKDGFHNPFTHDVHFGMSLAAAFRLARSKGYSLFYVEDMGVNAFWIRDDLAKKLADVGWPMNDINLIYTPCSYGESPRYNINGVDVGSCHPVELERVHKYGPWLNVVTGADWLPVFVPGFTQQFSFP